MTLREMRLLVISWLLTGVEEIAKRIFALMKASLQALNKVLVDEIRDCGTKKMMSV